MILGDRLVGLNEFMLYGIVIMLLAFVMCNFLNRLK